MTNLLPANSTQLESDLSKLTGRIGDVPITIRDIWNPDTCPVSVLPWLAWAFSVDDWSPEWSEQQKRDTIKAAITIQELKGTTGSVTSALGALGIDARVQEWFNQIPAGAPYTYRLLLESFQTPVTEAGIAKVYEIVNTNKSLRSHLSEILVSARTAAPMKTGVAPGVGTELTIKFSDSSPFSLAAPSGLTAEWLNGGFSPALLFSNGESGAIYDPSDLTTLFQDSAGTIPVTTDGEPVGRINDKSGNGNHAFQASGSNRPIFRTDGSKFWIETNGTQYLTISGSKTSLSFCHDGSGGVIAGAASFGDSADPDALLALVGSNAGSTYNRGISLRYDDRSIHEFDNKIVCQITPGSPGVHSILFTSLDGTVLPQQPVSLISTFKTAPSDLDFRIYKDGSLLEQLEQANPPAAGDSGFDMEIMASGNGALPMVGKMFSLVILSRTLTNTERSDLSDYLASKSGSPI